MLAVLETMHTSMKPLAIKSLYEVELNTEKNWIEKNKNKEEGEGVEKQAH